MVVVATVLVTVAVATVVVAVEVATVVVMVVVGAVTVDVEPVTGKLAEQYAVAGGKPARSEAMTA